MDWADGLPLHSKNTGAVSSCTTSLGLLKARVGRVFYASGSGSVAVDASLPDVKHRKIAGF